MEREYEYLKDFIREDGTKSRRYCSEEEADFALVPIKELHGLRKAVKMLNDRSIHQIDKSKTDEHGFRVLRSDLKRYKGGKDELYLVTKETPYSSRMSLRDAKMLIENKLRELYTWTDDFKVLKNKDIAKLRTHWYKDSCQENGFLGSNSDEGREIFEIWQENPEMILEISKISTNYAQGLYEVSYWATEMI